jgi:hypothetical protein
LGIQGYPKLILFTNGTLYDFTRGDNRVAEEFVRFVQGGYLEVPPRPIPSGTNWFEAFRTGNVFPELDSDIVYN